MKIYNGMQGLGDNIYQRAVLPDDEPIGLVTSWPQLYIDMPNVMPIKSNTVLRTQKKNADAYRYWQSMPAGAEPIQIQYWDMGPPRGMEKAVGRAPRRLTLPDFGPRLVNMPYVVIRPNTTRREWIADARAPHNEYLHIAVQAARAAGYLIVSIADVDGTNEQYAGDPPRADLSYDRGQLHVAEIMRMVAHASGVIGGIGWLLPAAMAYGTRALIVAGGWGAYNHPRLLTDDRLGQHKITWAIPDNMCMCKLARHNCDKKISGFDRIAGDWAFSLAQ